MLLFLWKRVEAEPRENMTRVFCVDILRSSVLLKTQVQTELLLHRKGNIALYDEDCRSLGSSVQQVSVLMLVEGDSWW